MDSTYRIEQVTVDSPPSHFDQLAELHRLEIEGGFLATLGKSFLRRLYRGLAASPHGFVLAAVSGRRVHGFICGSTDTKRVYRQFLFSSGLSAVVYLLPKLFSWNRIRRILETVLYPSRHQDLALPPAEILNFCVARQSQRIGIGRELFYALVHEFQDREVERIRIVTGVEQIKAQQFYESLQATLQAEIEIHDGTKSLVYTYDIPVVGKHVKRAA